MLGCQILKYSEENGSLVPGQALGARPGREPLGRQVRLKGSSPVGGWGAVGFWIFSTLTGLSHDGTVTWHVAQEKPDEGGELAGFCCGGRDP